MSIKNWSVRLTIACLVLWQSGGAFAARISDVANTKHNFSVLADPLPTGSGQSGQTRVVQATSEQQICVFCHTPHGAEATQAPLWNRQLSSASYETYNTGSLDATAQGVALDQPNGVSKLCLSCHDGTMAIGAVNVLNGTYTDRSGQTAEIAVTGTGPGGRMAPGAGETTGFTRFIGTDLTNDHPISVLFDYNLAANDGEMRDPTPGANPQLVVRGGAQRPVLDDIHLEPDPGGSTTGGLVQCNSCHDPHIRETTNENIKFLRLNRLQKVNPIDNTFIKSQDIICLACHEKAGWAGSAHANQNVANVPYTQRAAYVREFSVSPATQVWESSCLACHDTHTAQGSRRLLREGMLGTKTLINTPAGDFLIKPGSPAPGTIGDYAIEETCYTCHSTGAGLIDRTLVGQGTAGFEVPAIEADFSLNTHMPIRTGEQQNKATEVHNIGTPNAGAGTGLGNGPGDGQRPQLGQDLIESPSIMGPGNRHAECTDCHNPHRVTRTRRFSDSPFGTIAASGTHRHAPPHDNIASGVLRGIWGVEPQYGSTAFMSNPSGFFVKRGDPGPTASEAVSSDYVTREYQVCLKCHSNYAYGTNPPDLGYYAGGTAPGTNGLFTYTNQAMEFQSPSDHTGEGTSDSPTGAYPVTFTVGGVDPGPIDWVTDNHRGWHPVMEPTGRTAAVRNADADNWLPPFNDNGGTNVGNQTMYCTDCHGSTTATGTVVPNNNGSINANTGEPSSEHGDAWGPHGSDDDFLLKGPWSGNRLTGTGEGQPSHLCFKCHDYDQYANGAAAAQPSGFGAGGNQCAMGGGMGGMGGMGGGMGCGAGNVNNLHVFHANIVTNYRCTLCHIAIPHGWKNKALLVNLNDVGPEVGLAAGTEVRTTGNPAPGYTNGGYYDRAALKIRTFAPSGQWQADDCGSSGRNGGNGLSGIDWMNASDEACINLP